MPVGRPGDVLPVWTFRVVMVVEGMGCPVVPASSGGIREMRDEGSQTALVPPMLTLVLRPVGGCWYRH